VIAEGTEQLNFKLDTHIFSKPSVKQFVYHAVANQLFTRFQKKTYPNNVASSISESCIEN